MRRADQRVDFSLAAEDAGLCFAVDSLPHSSNDELLLSAKRRREFRVPQGQMTVPYVNGYDFGLGADLGSGIPIGKVVNGEPTPVEHAGAPRRGLTSAASTRRRSSSRSW
jgi:hypothetical protein